MPTTRTVRKAPEPVRTITFKVSPAAQEAIRLGAKAHGTTRVCFVRDAIAEHLDACEDCAEAIRAELPVH